MKLMRAGEARTPMLFRSRTAEDIMTPNPLSVRESLTVHEAVGFLVDKGISGAPVIDDGGRPVGVITQSDILFHDRETAEHLDPPEFDSGHPLPPRAWSGFQIERVDGTRVRELMTPAVFAVGRTTPIRRVVQEMCTLNVHRLFVVDAAGVLVGVITALDLLRDLTGPDE
ncbi:MAG: CBS domain-containing protein [Gemmataceae bacterium]